MSRIIAQCGPIQFEISLNRTQTAQAILKTLPIESIAQRWGEEIYFEIPVTMKNEAPTLDVSIGDVGYWPDGHCFCIFFGKTPASKGNQPKPASEVTVIGRTDASPVLLGKVREGERIWCRRRGSNSHGVAPTGF